MPRTGRPKKRYKRAGPRIQPGVQVHQATYDAFLAWCRSRKQTAGELLEELMAAVVTTDGTILDQLNRSGDQ